VLKKFFLAKLSGVREALPTWAEWGAAGATALLLILAFPNFEFGFLAWIGLVPLLVAVVRRPSPVRALILGWFAGTVFFYATCYWLTYSMIHYGGLSPVLAYLLVLLPTIVVGIFPGLAMMLVALSVKRWGHAALLLAPVFWTAFELARLGITGQLWNALGYSQAFYPSLLGPARTGGVYAIGFLIVVMNAAVALVIIERTAWTIAPAALLTLLVIGIIFLSRAATTTTGAPASAPPFLNIVALQPNVPMTLYKTREDLKQLTDRHLTLSRQALQQLDNDLPRLVVWPESPMNFTYAHNKSFQDMVTEFARTNRTSLLFNSLEPASADGAYNSALLINEQGRLISQYDKIRLMPFGEYVPLPQWLPGASLISGIVGDFTPGQNYTLMPVAGHRAGVFICIESAYPWIARRLTNEGADVLINISNDGYLGPTAVMRQHLANTVLRAVENGRPLVRVTNTGLSALIRPDGRIEDQTNPFQVEVRNWKVSQSLVTDTFYTRHGDVFAYICAVVTAMIFIAALIGRKRSFADLR
jgi:apolipoprotein N-acyltransferase